MAVIGGGVAFLVAAVLLVMFAFSQSIAYFYVPGDLAKANVEAIVEAGRIYAGGAKALGQDVIASGREGIEQASDAVKTLAEAKSPAEFFQIQSELARASFDRFVAETSKLTERVVKLAGEAAEPLQTRASLNAERINTLVA